MKPCKHCGAPLKVVNMPPSEQFTREEPVHLCVRCDRLDLFPA